MRCKVGDVAIVIRSIAHNHGRLVAICDQAVRFDGSPGWLVRCVGGRTLGGRASHDGPITQCEMVIFLDTDLRPIRGVKLGPEALLSLLLSIVDGSQPALEPTFEPVEPLEAGVGIEPA